MKTQSLAGAWEFRQLGKDEWLPAKVPGGVHTDLLALGLIPDPFIGDNEKKVQWVAETDWEYRYPFLAGPDLLDQPYVWLVCDGLDTLATVNLNGKELGQASNMFRQYRWDVRSVLNIGQNDLRILFSSPVRFISDHQERRSLSSPVHSMAGGPYLRKAPCQFGWDWGPKLPPMGIWKDIRLESYRQARLKDVHLRQEHSGADIALEADISIERGEAASLLAVLQVTTPRGERLECQAAFSDGDDVRMSLPIPQPLLWWPNGYGDQPLYHIEVSIMRDDTSSGESLDQRSYKVGLRTLELRQEEDQWGRSFVFVVNGVPIFAKGSNWIPADTFPTRTTDQAQEDLIRSLAETHQNMLRVWGGGFYEEERFYDLCDCYGILVWQEFIFSCSIYPLDNPEFLENVHQEVVENVRRLRHRTSLALWCGNNEMEWGWVGWNWDLAELQDLKAAYDQFFHHTLRDWCQAEDPDHSYWPSSPSSDTPFIDPNGQRQGDCHYWDVWHGRKPFTDYRDQYPRFMSEFGFQALPPLPTIRTYAEESDWNMTSYIMEQHQKNASGNSLMVGQMLDTFRLPKDFPSLVYLSMVLQAEGVRYGVEHWRRHPDRVAGTLYWQLNDCWPVASWSSIDYYGRWKALHYAARHFYAPVMLSIEDKPPRQGIFITNDFLEPWEGKVDWSLESLDGAELTTGHFHALVGAQSALQVCDLDFSGFITDENMRQMIFIAELWQDDRLVQRQLAAFVPLKHLSLVDPGLAAKYLLEGDQLVITLTCRSLALLVEATLPGVDVIFSDNYFNLPAGRSIKITCPMPSGWTLERVGNELLLRSIYDSYL